jgi:hypothetical protein
MARVTLSGRTFLAGAIILVMLFIDLLSAQQAGEVRRIPIQTPRPLFELLVPGDRVVVIDKPRIFEAIYEEPPTVD